MSILTVFLVAITATAGTRAKAKVSFSPTHIYRIVFPADGRNRGGLPRRACPAGTQPGGLAPEGKQGDPSPVVADLLPRSSMIKEVLPHIKKVPS